MSKRACHAILILLMLLAPRAAWAGSLQAEATLDRNVVGVGESVTLQIVVRGDQQTEEPQLPSMPEFTIYSAGQSQNMMIVNGVVSTSNTFTYLLTPTREGTFTIPPIHVVASCDSAATQPLRLEVIKGAAPAAPSRRTTYTYPPGFPRMPGMPPGFPNMPMPPGFPPMPGMPSYPTARPSEPYGRGPAFVTGEIDNATPFVGQAITYTLKFYHVDGVTLSGQAQYPNTTGFINEDLPPERTYSKVVDGRTYKVNEVKVALLPTAEGSYDIGAAHLTCRIPLGFDEDFGNVLGASTEKDLETQPIKVTVRPLPDGRPADFTGGVGQFTLQSRLDGAGSARVGQALNLELTVEGQGNVKLVQAPHMPPIPGFKVYDPVASGTVTKKDYKLGGTRKFTVVLVPTRAGTLQLPVISLSYYDDKAGAYKTLSTRPQTVAVAPGAVAAPTDGAAPKTDGRGLRPNHTESGLDAAPVDLSSAAWFRLLQLAPAALLVTALVLWGPRPRRRVRRERAGAALRRAQTQLRKVPELSAVPPVLYGYLSEKLGASAQGLSTRDLLETLRARGVSAPELDQLAQLLAAAEQARYAPMQPPVAASITDAERLLAQLERSLS